MKLTESAAAALENIRQSQQIPEAHSTRLTAEQRPTGLGVRLEFVEEVPQGDQVAEQAGTQVHVDPKLAEPLADSTLDVEDTEEGLAFVFRPENP